MGRGERVQLRTAKRIKCGGNWGRNADRGNVNM